MLESRNVDHMKGNY